MFPEGQGSQGEGPLLSKPGPQRAFSPQGPQQWGGQHVPLSCQGQGPSQALEENAELKPDCPEASRCPAGALSEGQTRSQHHLPGLLVTC